MLKYVGRSVPRKEGTAKATGRAGFLDELRFEGALHARTFRSTIARGRLAGVRLALAGDGFTVVDWTDVPGRNRVSEQCEQPFLVEREIHHAAEPVLVLAHAERDALLAARVELDEEPGEPVLDAERAREAFKTVAIEKGDAAAALASAPVVVEGEYRTGHQEHAYLEPQGVVAVPDGDSLAIYGSLQCPFDVQRAVERLLGGAVRSVRVVATEIGGGFGGKEEYPALIAGHAALLAWKARRPVKLVYDRAEDMLATTKRHPAVVRHRTGLDRDGRLLAMEIDVLLDAGAYATLSPVVLTRACIHATGPYRCDAVRIRGRAARTNTPPNGAFRGFGATQTQFAIEVHLDRIAQAVGLDPVRLRERNALRSGDTTATGQRLGADTSALAVLRAAVRRSGYRRKRAAATDGRRGVGLALTWHGAGFTGNGERWLASRAALETTPDGVRILCASTEFGQGTRTMLAQIVAEALDVPFESVELAPADTSLSPDSGPTVASRTCMVVGRILQHAAEELRERLAGLSPGEYHRRHGTLSVTKEYEPPAGAAFDDERCRGDAYATFAFGCHVAEVELDRDTFEARPSRLTAVVEVGRAVHPVLARGQVEGGTAQGVGGALFEHVTMRGGRMTNARLGDYRVPRACDTPRIDVVLLESPFAGGPYGAKGLGELPIHGPAPALVNALRSLGLDLREVPVRPDAILEAACGSS
ncbi:MAG TPA: xanthine dehydrogenase family protein molybdopterin-binding subunit [Myxococcota bacterium]|nr:xanthine dehydrogenase family protein molybdopterin-binding subunit [Myxococcota bacterium]